MKLSVLIPVLNEAATISEVVRRVLAVDVDSEVIVVDDGSTDGTWEELQRLSARWPDRLVLCRHDRNRGKGAAIRTATEQVTGDVIVIQDADLEYDPADFPRLLEPLASSDVQVVYGSRNLGQNPRSSSAFYLGGVFLSRLTNLLFGSSITDEATCYKLFRADLFRSLGVASRGFEFCPEVTAKVLRRGLEIVEVPISYTPRSRAEGKKIRWVDGLVAIWTLVRYRVSG